MPQLMVFFIKEMRFSSIGIGLVLDFFGQTRDCGRIQICVEFLWWLTLIDTLHWHLWLHHGAPHDCRISTWSVTTWNQICTRWSVPTSWKRFTSSWLLRQANSRSTDHCKDWTSFCFWDFLPVWSVPFARECYRLWILKLSFHRSFAFADSHQGIWNCWGTGVQVNRVIHWSKCSFSGAPWGVPRYHFLCPASRCWGISSTSCWSLWSLCTQGRRRYASWGCWRVGCTLCLILTSVVKPI